MVTMEFGMYIVVVDQVSSDGMHRFSSISTYISASYFQYDENTSHGIPRFDRASARWRSHLSGPLTEETCASMKVVFI